MVNGIEVTNLRDIPEETTLLVCGKNKNFKGVVDSNKMVSYGGSIKLRKKNIQKCLFTKTYKWMRDNMLGWAHENEKVELADKVIDIGKQTNAADPPPKPLVGMTDFSS